MRIHALQHVDFEGLGSIAEWIKAQGHSTLATRLYGGEPLPPTESMDLLVVLGGPMGVGDEQKYPWLIEEKRFIEQVIRQGTKVLGICLGAQLVAQVLGATVSGNREKEIGWFTVARTAQSGSSPMFADFPERLEVFHWHGDTFSLPAGAVHVFRSEGCEHQGFAVGDQIVGLQFHLETTPDSARSIIQHCAGELVAGRYIQQAEEMLADNDRFTAINGSMCRLLDLFSSEKN